MSSVPTGRILTKFETRKNQKKITVSLHEDLDTLILLRAVINVLYYSAKRNYWCIFMATLNTSVFTRATC